MPEWAVEERRAHGEVPRNRPWSGQAARRSSLCPALDRAIISAIVISAIVACSGVGRDEVNARRAAKIDFGLDIEGRTARAHIEGVLEMRGEPILNPVTGAEHHVRIVQPNGFEFVEAEIGRGWSKTQGPIGYELADSYGQFAHIHLCQSGMVR
ncbi:MAG: DUF1326 domain-containing protein [Methyloceanibacter sp.]